MPVEDLWNNHPCVLQWVASSVCGRATVQANFCLSSFTNVSSDILALPNFDFSCTGVINYIIIPSFHWLFIGLSMAHCVWTWRIYNCKAVGVSLAATDGSFPTQILLLANPGFHHHPSRGENFPFLDLRHKADFGQPAVTMLCR